MFFSFKLFFGILLDILDDLSPHTVITLSNDFLFMQTVELGFFLVAITCLYTEPKKKRPLFK